MKILWVTLLLAGSNFRCGQDVHKIKFNIFRVGGGENAGNADESRSKPTNEEEEASGELSLRELQAAYGIRSFDQVLSTMGVLTQVDPGAAPIQLVYQEVQTQLPSSNDIKTFLASQQVGVSKLAVEFCDALMADANLRARVLGGFDFSRPASLAFAGSGKRDLASRFVDRFWGTGLAGLPDRGGALDELETLTSALLVGANQSSQQTTLSTAKGVCSAVLSSAPVMIF